MYKEVLLVDDDGIALMLYEIAIKKANFSQNISKATNGKLALELLTEREERGLPMPELIFLDLNMPVLNGWEFLKEYQKEFEPKDSKAKIIVLSSSVDPADVEYSKKFKSVIKFMSKPLATQALLEMKEEK
jgi:CheY-like chemotaxis protein